MIKKSKMEEMSSMGKRLRNFSSRVELHDTLHNQASEVGVCSDNVCHGSLMNIRKMKATLRPSSEVLQQAKIFITEYYSSIGRSGSDEEETRWKEIVTSVNSRGTYRLTREELEFGTKLAWRNAPRCIGRIHWLKLELFDARDVSTPKEMFEAICRHLEYSTNGGNIRSAITVFPERVMGRRDFRVWNKQLIAYAGYANADGLVTGDPSYLEFTQVCEYLGWKGKRNHFDVLPIVVTSATGKPMWFDLPDELVLRVPLKHPKYEAISKMGLEWFAVPAVSSMMLDVGGLQFPAAPFNGWYMSTEVASRDLCDKQRYDLLKVFAEKMDLDTKTNSSLWKDDVNVEVNKAVLYSYKAAGVTIVDHHTASESFIHFMSNEHCERGGCPADWTWIVPPISGSITPVFHQEMSLYYLKPAYEYQESAWKDYALYKPNTSKVAASHLFRKATIAVRFATILYHKILAMRLNVLILYATETGRSQLYANKMLESLKLHFNPKVMNVRDFPVNKNSLNRQPVMLLLASTTGNGEPPEDSMNFIKALYQLKEAALHKQVNNEEINAFMKHPTKTENNTNENITSPNVSDEQTIQNGKDETTERSACWRKMLLDYIWAQKNVDSNLDSVILPAEGLRFAVFALGSTKYKNYCLFGKYLSNLLEKCGGRLLFPVTCGDELNNQEHTYDIWASNIIKILRKEVQIKDGQQSNKLSVNKMTTKRVRLTPYKYTVDPLEMNLSRIHRKTIFTCPVVESVMLFDHGDRWCRQLILKIEETEEPLYFPGDHVGIFPHNSSSLVSSILRKLSYSPHFKEIVKVEVGQENEMYWQTDYRLPPATLRELLTYYLDLTTPPSRDFLLMLASHATNPSHAKKLNYLAQDEKKYKEWRSWRWPNVLEVLEEFPSVTVDSGALVAALPLLQPRYYSISSCPFLYPGQLHLTISGVHYFTQGGSGPVHRGVATEYLKKVEPGNKVNLFYKRTPTFNLPKDLSAPVILVGASSGVAPLRGFWQHYNYLMKTQGITPGPLTLFFGCRDEDEDLYGKEKSTMVKQGCLTRHYLALSRSSAFQKIHVDDLLRLYSKDVYRQLVEEGGHIYVCGSEALAENVSSALQTILLEQGHLTPNELDKLLVTLKVEERYHEDHFCIY